MKRIITFLFLALSFTAFSQQADYAPKQFIADIKLPAGKDAVTYFLTHAALSRLNDSLKLESVRVIGNKKTNSTLLLKFKDEINVLPAITAYSKTGLFEYVEPDFIGHGHGIKQTTPNDLYFSSRQWSHVNNGTFDLSAVADADIDTDMAWDITQGDPNLIVAVLDTGLRLTHPEFAGRIVDGWDFVNNDNNPTDDYGHGTNVTGIALATGNNAVGYAGVNWNSKIMSCKILDQNNIGYYSNWADAIYYAVDHGAKVINLSAGGDGSSTTLLNAANYAYNNNVSLVVSTGNQNGTIQYPAKYNSTIAVGATDSNDVRSNPFFWSATSGSNFGPEIDVVAPGNFIYGLDYASDTQYGYYWGGTSQAAPHVAGVISLMLSVNPDITVNEIRQILMQSSEDQVGDVLHDTPGWDEYYGHGRLNAYNALISPLLSGSEYIAESKNIQVYPNPVTSGSFEIGGFSPESHYDIRLLTLDGKTIKTVKCTGATKASIECTALSPGTYLAVVSNTARKHTFVKKVIRK
ncbi:S8 family peptidase [Flavobacterium pallidum]|uniref:Peptidase S8 n=1 Tax=Flavobacterium pallidum TaxID=2172098 RepID=A0A2S1SKR1_9FLAO|nr:S8 family peptidase [Flavobacterium pallidum]AWI26927.1 hypothetical protein HYN49_14005 [Flavobacterium pallidum]